MVLKLFGQERFALSKIIENPKSFCVCELLSLNTYIKTMKLKLRNLKDIYLQIRLKN